MSATHWHLSMAPKATVRRAQGSGFVHLADAQRRLREAAHHASVNTGEALVEDVYVVGEDVLSLVACTDRRCRPRETA